jgi:hypothetical protein
MSDLDVKAIEPVPSQVQDKALYRMVVGALALGLLLTLVGALVLAALGIEVSAAVIAIGAGCMGALGGLLAPSPAK